MPWFAEFCPFMFVVSFVARPWPAKCPGKNVGDRAAESRALSDRVLQPFLPTTRQIQARNLAADDYE